MDPIVQTTFRFVNRRVPRLGKVLEGGIVAVSKSLRLEFPPPPSKPDIRGQRGDWPRILGARRARKLARRGSNCSGKFCSTATGSDLSRNSVDRGLRAAPTSFTRFFPPRLLGSSTFRSCSQDFLGNWVTDRLDHRSARSTVARHVVCSWPITCHQLDRGLINIAIGSFACFRASLIIDLES